MSPDQKSPAEFSVHAYLDKHEQAYNTNERKKSVADWTFASKILNEFLSNTIDISVVTRNPTHS